MNAATLTALRMLFSIPFFMGLILWVQHSQTSIKLRRADWEKMIFIGVFTGYGSMWLNFAGLSYVTAGLEREILFLYPTIVVFSIQPYISIKLLNMKNRISV